MDKALDDNFTRERTLIIFTLKTIVKLNSFSCINITITWAK